MHKKPFIREVKYFHSSGRGMPNGHPIQRGGFVCECRLNADTHSSKNIKFRLTSTVLRGNLLVRAGDSEYRYFIPKGLLPRWKVKKCLEKCRCDGLFKQTIENHSILTMSKFEKILGNGCLYCPIPCDEPKQKIK